MALFKNTKGDMGNGWLLRRVYATASITHPHYQDNVHSIMQDFMDTDDQNTVLMADPHLVPGPTSATSHPRPKAKRKATQHGSDQS